MKRLSLALAALLAVGGAQAATISFQFGQPLSFTTTEINQTGALGLFNSSLGTLTGASLQIFGGAVFNYSGTNNASGTVTANLRPFTDLSFGSSLAAVDALLVDTISLTTASGSQTYVAGQTRSFGPTTETGTFTYNLGSILSSLIGAGTFNINCTSESGITTAGGGGNFNSAQTTVAGCGARITYTYTEPVTPPPGVPEPASLALVGLALAGAAAASRRRKQG